jgi:ABC-type Fe3+-siderophore transport system permease subunit
MNPPNDSRGSQPSQHPLSEAAKASLVKTHTLLRIFMVVVFGSFFVYQLDISYLWLSAILTAAAIVLGIMVLIRAAKLKESKLVLFGAISGLVVAAVQVLMLLSSALFFTQFRDYQQCSRQALTQQAASQCQTQLEKSLPFQLG